MSNTIYLDRNKTADLEPSEGDERNGFWISPFEVPKSFFLHCETGFKDIRAVTFKYPGGETGRDWASLDDRNDPAVLVRSGQQSQKILELTFARPISLEQLRSVGERLRIRARGFRVLATQFNYKMIAAIFQNWESAVDPIE
jgi:hypothetical protein